MRLLCPIAALFLFLSCVETADTPPQTRRDNAPPLPENVEEELEEDLCVLSGPDRVLAVIDVSGSMQFTDQNAARRVAIDRLARSLGDDMELAVVTIGSEPLPASPGFSPAAEFVAPFSLGNADVLTDLEGSLRAAREVLAADMAASDAARYAVVVLTDGAPTPVCCANETDAPGPSAFGCAATADADGRNGSYRFCGPTLQMEICDSAEHLEHFRAANGEGALPGLSLGGAYNTPETLGVAVDELIATAADAGVELSLRFALLDDVDLDPSVREIYRLNSCEARGLLTELSARTGDELTLFERAADIDLRPLVGECAPR